MASAESKIDEIHLPERWVVLQDALRQIQASAQAEDEAEDIHRLENSNPVAAPAKA